MIGLTVSAAVFLIGRGFLFSSAYERRKNGIFLPVIMYHSIYDGTPQEYIVTPQQLNDDLRWLSENGYKSVTADELTDYVCGAGILPPKPVMITFDDGFYNNLSVALPILEKYDMSAVVSVVGAYTDNDAQADPHAERYSYLTWDDISELQASGRVEIGCHTYDMHSVTGKRKGCAKLPSESEEEYKELLQSDITLAQNRIAEHTGKRPIVFAYPFGAESPESVPVLRENGFIITLLCREAPNYITRKKECLYDLFRYNRSGFYTTQEFMEKVMRQ